MEIIFGIFETIKFVIGMILACGIITSPFLICWLADKYC